MREVGVQSLWKAVGRVGGGISSNYNLDRKGEVGVGRVCSFSEVHTKPQLYVV